MLVYGDRSMAVDAWDRLAGALDLWQAAGRREGLSRHAGLVAAFILAAELAQGVADEDFAGGGEDDPTPASIALTLLLNRMAGDIAASWDSGFTAPPGDMDCGQVPGLPSSVTCRQPEGYAFYALYPEGYAEAARGLPKAPHAVIGLRSIGTGLAAMVAARTQASVTATLRPNGHPFRRKVTPGPELRRTLLSDPGIRYAVVDEGPGLSGSSFGAVCDWLEDRGVGMDRVTLLTGHANPPGPEAAPRHRERWPRLDRRCVGFEELVLHAVRPVHRLERWVSDIAGEPAVLAGDLSGGAWRRRLIPEEARWPACDTLQERRKYLFDTPSGPAVARFAGLGVTGEHKLARARALFEAGFAPEPLGLAHGFLVERWHAGARPLTGADAGEPALLNTLARYVGFRARAFPAERESGAFLGDLAAMAVQNVSEALGEDAGRRLGRLAAAADRLGHGVSRVETDGRMDAHEWIALPDGRLLKTDALDHHAAHDLVGCQDPAWDVAGAAVEFGLDATRAERLRRDAEAVAGRPILPELVAFHRICWIAFRIGLFAMATASHAAHPAEQARLRARLEGYARAMRMELAG